MLPSPMMTTAKTGPAAGQMRRCRRRRRHQRRYLPRLRHRADEGCHWPPSRRPAAVAHYPRRRATMDRRKPLHQHLLPSPSLMREEPRCRRRYHHWRLTRGYRDARSRARVRGYHYGYGCVCQKRTGFHR